MNDMMGGMPPQGGGGNEWLMQLLNALFGQQRGQPGGMPPMAGGMGQTPMGGGMPGGQFPQGNGFPTGPRMPMPGTMDRTTPDQGTVTPGQSPFHPPRMPRMGGY